MAKNFLAKWCFLPSGCGTLPALPGDGIQFGGYKCFINGRAGPVIVTGLFHGLRRYVATESSSAQVWEVSVETERRVEMRLL